MSHETVSACCISVQVPCIERTKGVMFLFINYAKMRILQSLLIQRNYVKLTDCNLNALYLLHFVYLSSHRAAALHLGVV